MDDVLRDPNRPDPIAMAYAERMRDAILKFGTVITAADYANLPTRLDELASLASELQTKYNERNSRT